MQSVCSNSTCRNQLSIRKCTLGIMTGFIIDLHKLKRFEKIRFYRIIASSTLFKWAFFLTHLHVIELKNLFPEHDIPEFVPLVPNPAMWYGSEEIVILLTKIGKSKRKVKNIWFRYFWISWGEQAARRGQRSGWCKGGLSPHGATLTWDNERSPCVRALWALREAPAQVTTSYTLSYRTPQIPPRSIPIIKFRNIKTFQFHA